MVLGFEGNFKGCCAALVECMCVQCGAVQGSLPLVPTRDVNTQYGGDVYFYVYMNVCGWGFIFLDIIIPSVAVRVVELRVL